MTATLNKEIAVVQKKGQSPLVEKANVFEITDAEAMEVAAGMLTEMNRIADVIKAEKEKETKPLNEAIAAVRKRWKGVEDYFTGGIAGLRRKIGAYQTEQIAKQREAEAKLAARVGEGKGKLRAETAVRKMDEIERPDTKITAQGGMLRFRPDRVLEITDLAALKKYVTETGDWSFMEVNERLLLSLLKTGKVIPGATVKEVQIPINSR
jgi:hypothetical protein